MPDPDSGGQLILSELNKNARTENGLQSFLSRVPLLSQRKRVYSRVLKDPWHLMDMILRVLPSNHRLRHHFSTAFRDILFIPDPEDQAQIEQYAKKIGEILL